MVQDTAARIWLGGTHLSQAIVVNNFLTPWALGVTHGARKHPIYGLGNQKIFWPLFRFLPETGCRNNPVSLECLVTSDYSVTDLFGPSQDPGRLGILIVEGAWPWPWFITMKFALQERTMKSPLKLISSLATAASTTDLFEEATVTTNSVFMKFFLGLYSWSLFTASSRDQVRMTLD